MSSVLPPSSRPGPLSDTTVREAALVLRNDFAALSMVDTIHPRQRIGGRPQLPSVSFKCDSTRVWTFAGTHTTGSDGRLQIKLAKFLDCIPMSIDGSMYSNYIGSVPSFVATAQTEAPVLVTCTIEALPLQPPQGQAFAPQAFDITVDVRTWNHDGSAKPNVPFGWVAVARISNVSNF